MKKTTDRTLYASPFEKGYWRAALSEFKSLRMLVMAALFAGLRIAIKLVSVSLFNNALKISFDFFINSVGSMIYGPVVGLLVGAVSDSLGYLVKPDGAYFLPYILVEMSSSFIFGLFLYRAKLTKKRIVLSRLTVVVFCNLILNSLILWLQDVIMGTNYIVFRWLSVVKNLCLFPAEALALCIWLASISVVTYKMKLTHAKPEKFKITFWNVVIVILIVLVLVALAVGCIMAFPYIKDFLKANNIK